MVADTRPLHYWQRPLWPLTPTPSFLIQPNDYPILDHANVTAAIKDKTADLGTVKLADGIIVTPLLVQNNPKVILFDNNFKQIVPDSYQADIKYVINRADVRKSEMDKDEIGSHDAQPPVIFSPVR